MGLLRRRLTGDNMDNVFTEMERIKNEISVLEAKYKLLHEKAKNSDVQKKKMKTGTFSRVTKENWEVVDKQGIIALMGQEDYNEYSSISKTGITKAGGDNLFKKATGKGFIAAKSKTEYFTFKKAAK